MLTTTAYVLIEGASDQAAKIVKALQKVKGVKSAHAVTGPYDVVVCVEASDVAAVSAIVHSKVRTLKGVTRAVTCVAVKEADLPILRPPDHADVTTRTSIHGTLVEGNLGWGREISKYLSALPHATRQKSKARFSPRIHISGESERMLKRDTRPKDLLEPSWEAIFSSIQACDPFSRGDGYTLLSYAIVWCLAKEEVRLLKGIADFLDICATQLEASFPHQHPDKVIENATDYAAMFADLLKPEVKEFSFLARRLNPLSGDPFRFREAVSRLMSEVLGEPRWVKCEMETIEDNLPAFVYSRVVKNAPDDILAEGSQLGAWRYEVERRIHTGGLENLSYLEGHLSRADTMSTALCYLSGATRLYYE